MVHRALDRGLRQHPRSLLEGGRGNEGIGRERRLGDAQQQRTPGRGFAAIHDGAFVFLAETELVELLLEQELSIAHVFDFHPAHHLANDHFDVLVANVYALQPVNLLDFIHQVRLQLFFAQNRQDVVRVEGAVHQRLTGTDALAFLHVDMHTARHRVFFLGAVIGDDVDLSLSLADLAKFHGAINLADDRRLPRLAGLKQFDHARQAAGDVFGFGSFARNLGQDVARINRIAILHHQVGARRHEITLAALALDHDCRLPLLVGRLGDYQARETGDLVYLLVQGHSLLQVFEAGGAADFGYDGESVGVPLHQDLAKRNRNAIVHFYLGAVNHRIALLFTTFLIKHRD